MGNLGNLFFCEKRPKMRAENPNISGNEISKIIGRQWSDLSPQQRQPYIEKASEIREQFKRDNPDWHYEKSNIKYNKRRNRNESQFLFYQNENSFNRLTMTGSLFLANFVLSRKDLQEDLASFIENQKASNEIQ